MKSLKFILLIAAAFMLPAIATFANSDHTPPKQHEHMDSSDESMEHQKAHEHDHMPDDAEAHDDDHHN